jgi:Amidohydrolase family
VSVWSPMSRIVALLCVVTFAATLVFAARQQQASSASTVIAVEHATVINVATGARWPDQTVVVTGNRIASVGASGSVSIPAGARTVDGLGKFLIPGIWDMHVHALFNGINRTLPYLAAIGITGIRDMASSFEQVAEVRRQKDNGAIWPRLVVSGPGLDGVPPNFPFPVPEGVLLVITSPQQGRDIVNRLAAARVDLIKVRNGLSRETYFAIAEEAKRWRLPFDGHLPPEVNIVEASDTGQRVVEHLPGLQALCAANPAALRPGPGNTQPIELNRVKCEETVRHLVRNRTWFDPTVGGPGQGDARIRQFNLQLVSIAAQAGVQMLAGTDWPGGPFMNPDGNVHRELQGLVEAGLTPQQALVTAIVNPAILLNMTDQLGSIEQGKLADLLLLDGDPLVDITNTTRIAVVIADGKLIDAALRQKLLDAEAAARQKR